MEDKTVWILGSGFSKPLGGPLLRDLFRQENEEDTAAFFPEKIYPGLAKALPWVQKIFHNGVKDGFWENAEQFLGYVDDAYHDKPNNPHRRRIAHLINRSDVNKPRERQGLSGLDPLQAYYVYKDNLHNDFDKKVKRALASDCFRFTMNADCESELWDPHTDWVDSLVEGVDTIVSFNYDLVVEMAGNVSTSTAKIHVVAPSPTAHLSDLPTDKVPLIKLHGSVNWRMQADASGKRTISPETVPADTVLRSEDDDLAIAAPGGSKARFVSSYLGPLWVLAERALEEATAVMVVGYSFPDTDPMASRRLLQALERRTGALRRQAHIILGADVTTPPSQRVVSLLKSTSNARPIMPLGQLIANRGNDGLAVHQLPLGTQDFIGRHRSFLSALAVETD